MKRKLLLIASFALLTLSSNAQNKTWNFSDAIFTTTPEAGGSVNYSVDGLNFICGGSSHGATKNSVVTYSDGFVSAKGIDFQKATPVVDNVVVPPPTKRAVSFDVTGPCTVTVWGTTSSTNRVVAVTDPTAVLGSFNTTTSKTFVYSYEYTGVANTLYVATNNTITLAKIAVTYGALSTDSFQADASATVYANGNQVFVSNVKSATTVSVYSVTGALVKTVDVSTDTNFDIASGVWIVKTKSAEGEKSVKLLVK